MMRNRDAAGGRTRCGVRSTFAHPVHLGLTAKKAGAESAPGFFVLSPRGSVFAAVPAHSPRIKPTRLRCSVPASSCAMRSELY